MSNFLYGRILVTDSSKVMDSSIYSYITRFGDLNNFAVSFIDTLPTKSTPNDINFRISDNSHVQYCEYFLEPPIFTVDGFPIIEEFDSDLSKLQELIRGIFTFNFTQKIELRFSFVEVDEEEYEIYETDIENMKDVIFLMRIPSITTKTISTF